MTKYHVPLRPYDQARRRTRRPVPRPDRRYLAGELTRTTSSARCACRTACTSSATRRCCASPCPTACCRHAAARLAHIAASTTAATATSPPARTSSSTGRRTRGRARHPGRPGHRRDARHPDFRQLHPQHHHRPLAGVAADEIIDPRPWPKSCASGRPSTRNSPSCRASSRSPCRRKTDRAVTRFHDIGLHPRSAADGEIGFRVSSAAAWAAPRSAAKIIREFLPWQHMLTYCEAILRVYNRYGRRDNLYKARIKILVQALGAGRVQAPGRRRMGARARTARHHHRPKYDRVAAHFTGTPAYASCRPSTPPRAQRWPPTRLCRAGSAQRAPTACRLRGGHPLAEETGHPPGDITADQMDIAADWPTRTASANCASPTSRT
jgi:hypothetical protein